MSLETLELEWIERFSDNRREESCYAKTPQNGILSNCLALDDSNLIAFATKKDIEILNLKTHDIIRIKLNEELKKPCLLELIPFSKKILMLNSQNKALSVIDITSKSIESVEFGFEDY